MTYDNTSIPDDMPTESDDIAFDSNGHVDPFSIYGNDDDEFSLKTAKEQQRVYEEHFKTFPNYQNSSKYLVYYCREKCGGYADRMKGIEEVYILSVITKRRFAIHWTDPCPIEHFLQHNLLDWNVDLDNLGGKTLQYLDYKESHLAMRFAYEKNDFHPNEMIKSDVVLMKANQDWTEMFRHLSVTAETFPQLYSYTSSDLMRIIYHGLFKQGAHLKATVERLFEDDVKGKKLACFHARMGDWEAKNERYTFEQITPVFDFLKKFDQSEYKIMVASDSERVKSHAKELFSENLIDTVGPIIHIDKIKNTTVSENLKCAAFMRALIDHQVLTSCDELVLTNSGFGVLAAHLRHTSRGLNVFFNTHGVFPVRRETLREAFQYHCLGPPVAYVTVCDG